MAQELTLAFIGGGNMASALASGLIGKRCGAHDVHIVDPGDAAREHWTAQGCSAAPVADERGRRTTFAGLGVVMAAWTLDALLQAVAGPSPLFL